MANNRRGAGGPFNITSPGTTILMLFIGVAIGFSILMTRGIFPASTLTDPGETGELEVVDDPLSGGQKGLQLRTIKFRECANKAAVGLLVDQSGSMGFGNKAQSLKTALTTFTSTLGDQSVIGLYYFSRTPSEVVPFSRYKDVKGTVANAISRFSPYGPTYTRSAFQLISNRMIPALSAFPNNSFALILLSDGIPETDPRSCTAPACSPDRQRCFATAEDPTVNPNLVDTVKQAGVRVFSIALYDAGDTCFQNDLKSMMQRIASPNSYYETPNASDLQKIYKEIAQKICNEVK